MVHTQKKTETVPDGGVDIGLISQRFLNKLLQIYQSMKENHI